MSDDKKELQRYEKKDLTDSEKEPKDLLQTALNNLTPQQKNEIAQKATEEAIKIEIKKQEMIIQDEAAAKDIQKHLYANNCFKAGLGEGHKITQNIKTATGDMRIESRKGAACFIATVVYGDMHAQPVQFLRAYRDFILMKSILGQVFVKWYYFFGPKVADFIDKKSAFLKIARFFLDTLVKFIKKRTSL